MSATTITLRSDRQRNQDTLLHLHIVDTNYSSRIPAAGRTETCGAKEHGYNDDIIIKA